MFALIVSAFAMFLSLSKTNFRLLTKSVKIIGNVSICSNVSKILAMKITEIIDSGNA